MKVWCSEAVQGQVAGRIGGSCGWVWTACRCTTSLWDCVCDHRCDMVCGENDAQHQLCVCLCANLLAAGQCFGARVTCCMVLGAVCGSTIGVLQLWGVPPRQGKGCWTPSTFLSRHSCCRSWARLVLLTEALDVIFSILCCNMHQHL